MTLDQIIFISRVFGLSRLDQGYRRRVADPVDEKSSPELISAILRHGALECVEAQIEFKIAERSVRNMLSKLTAAGYLISVSTKTPVRLAF